ncbi:type II secretion system protein GspL [Roseateles saccharophilus]|uniref:Type II secretion system protein L (GspL) n=1 Tax=Roseateles saccharophilus TaxID=304 RepID=A0A4R3UJ49_ROSSA|nr:type II secretion system protein GspL [Roseateles saccharophilus]MDG0834063.1 general secretion pathway protein GspL [Roseateles saccharophilus]TCU90792.1 type II secretion system protein L (GspL) [Roseateles saccharophilus]
MSTLLLFLPPRPRLRAPGQATPAADAQRANAAREYDYALTSDGRQLLREGRADLARLPAADTVVAVMPESDISWRRVELPRAGRQMRAALAGKLEEALLDEPEALHFALEPDAVGGDTAWVAVTSRPWLAEQLAQLDAAQVFVDRVAPLAWPDEPARGHFFESGPDGVALRWSHADGVATLPLDGGLARQFFPPGLVHAAQWTATPGVATVAERWLGTTVGVQTPAQRALAVVDSAWNLRQFDLAPRARGARALRLVSRALMRKPWRPVRYGIAALVLVQLLGLNLWAWRQNSAVKNRRAAISATLTDAFPQIHDPLDPPVQMQKNLDLLRAGAGSFGEQDLEALLAAAATAWPGDRPPTEALAFEPGRLTVSAQGWSQPQIDNFRTQLQSEGWQLDAGEGKLTISRASARGRS